MKPKIQILSSEEIKHIDRLSRDVLNNVGFICEDEEAIDYFGKAGAKVDISSKRVFLSDSIISDAISMFIPEVTLYGRNGREPMHVGGNNLYFGTTGMATNYYDAENDEYRPSTTNDMIEMMKLCEVLSPPDYMLCNIAPTDVEAEYVDLYEFKAGMLYSSKHIEAEATDLKNANKIIKMAEFMAGGSEKFKKAPFFSFLVTLTSPLHQRSDSTQLIIEGAKHNIPLFIESGPMAGATSPVTLAETVAIANAELLSSMILAKLVNPDVPTIYASWARIINMKNALVSIGAPEFGMLRIATTQMGKFYGLPTGGGANITDSLSLDSQSGAELLATSLLPALSDINMAQGMGLLAGMNAASSDVLIVASEIANYVKHIRNGINVDMSSVGYDLIEKIGPSGNYLGDDHTLFNFKKELWTRTIFDCSPVREGKTEHHKTGMLAMIKKKKAKLLSNYKRPECPEDAESVLEDIIRS